MNEENSFQEFKQEMTQKLNSKLYDRLMEKKKKMAAKIIKGDDEPEALDVPTMTPEEIADKHGVPLEDILDQLKMGIKVEHEHTSDKTIAREIALDHLGEIPDYYTRLSDMEKAIHPSKRGWPMNYYGYGFGFLNDDSGGEDSGGDGGE